jgi:inhibitor of KinA
MSRLKVFALGECAVIVEFSDHYSSQTLREIQQFSHSLQITNKDWIEEWTTAFTTVTIYFDLMKVSDRKKHHEDCLTFITKELNKIVTSSDEVKNVSKHPIEIPICYDEEFAPDLKEVANRNQISEAEVISLHCSAIYDVAMIGFSPGFPFLLGLPKKITIPRKKTPRLKIAAGSVGIAGEQTGIYPMESPGGWQIIGRTPIHLFRPHEKEPSLLKAGDKVKFIQITKKQFYQLESK